MKLCLWKMQLGFWNYALIRLFGPTSPNVVSRHQIQRSRNALRFHNFIGFIFWFWKKWGPAYEIWSYISELMAWHVLVRLLGPSCPNVVSKSHAPRSRNLLRSNDFIWFILWFWGKWSPVCEKWSYGSRIMAW